VRPRVEHEPNRSRARVVCILEQFLENGLTLRVRTQDFTQAHAQVDALAEGVAERSVVVRRHCARRADKISVDGCTAQLCHDLRRAIRRDRA
jgi:hypothetical protein